MSLNGEDKIKMDKKAEASIADMKVKKWSLETLGSNSQDSLPLDIK